MEGGAENTTEEYPDNMASGILPSPRLKRNYTHPGHFAKIYWEAAIRNEGGEDKIISLAT